MASLDSRLAALERLKLKLDSHALDDVLKPQFDRIRENRERRYGKRTEAQIAEGRMRVARFSGLAATDDLTTRENCNGNAD